MQGVGKCEWLHRGKPVFLALALDAPCPRQMLKAGAKVGAAVHVIQAVVHFAGAVRIHAHDLQGHVQVLLI